MNESNAEQQVEPQSGTFKAAAITQVRVIGALILRETRARFGRTQLGYIWAIAEPIAFVVVLSVVFTVIDRQFYFGNDVPLFFATGILPFLLYKKLATSLGSAFIANKALLTYPIVKEVDTLFARALLEIGTSIVVMTIVYFGLVIFVESQPPANIQSVFFAFMAMALLGFGFGTINAVLAGLFESWRNIESIITRPMFIISGVIFPLERLPEKIQEILLWNPVLHGVEWMRSGYFLNYPHQNYDPKYCLLFGAGLTLAGLAGERVFRERRRRIA